VSCLNVLEGAVVSNSCRWIRVTTGDTGVTSTVREPGSDETMCLVIKQVRVCWQL
jgi:hypothetical protein